MNWGRPQVAPTVAYIFSFDKTKAPSDEGAVERSETEGEKAINSKFSLSLPQSFFCSKKMTAPFTREPLSDNRKGCPYGLCVYFNMIFSRELHIILTINGGSKPPPYIIRYTIQFVRITDFCGFRAQEYFCTIVFNFTRIINFQQQKGELCSPVSF